MNVIGDHIISLDDNNETIVKCPKSEKKVFFLSCGHYFCLNDNRVAHIVECVECGKQFVEVFKHQETYEFILKKET